MTGFSLDDIILAFALKDKKYAMELTNSVDSKYFIEKRWIFDAVKSHFLDPKYRDLPTKNVIKEKLEKIKNGDELSYALKEFDGITDLSSKIDPAEFSWNLNKLRERYNKIVQDECVNVVEKIKSSSIDESEKLEKTNKVIKQAVANIDSIYKKQVYKEGSLNESAKERAKKYEEIAKNPDSAKGILTGFSQFDRITNGLHPGELMIVAGDTGTGKSVLMHNIGVNAYLGKNNPLSPLECLIANSGYNVLYFSLEMPKEIIERRIDSCMGELYYNQIRDGILSDDDKRKYFNILKFQTKHQKRFHIIDMPQKVNTRDIELKYMEILESKFKPELVIIDYMGIMTANDGAADSDWLTLGQITEDLHTFARTYEIPVITGSQVNRPKELGKQEYSTNRIARSGMAPTNANIVIQIGCREDEYIRTDMPIYITKMRDGEKGSFILSKNFAKMKIIDIVDETFANDDEED